MGKINFLIYPLKLFSSLFSFLIDILNFFKDIFSSIIGYIKSNVSSLTGQKLMNPDEGLWEKLKEIFKIIFTVTVGGSVIYFFKEMQTFLLNSFIKIGDLLFKIVLRILDIMAIVLKIWLLLLKKVIIILGFIFSFLMNIIFLWVYEENEPSKAAGVTVINSTYQVMGIKRPWNIIPFIVIATLLFLLFWFSSNIKQKAKEFNIALPVKEPAKVIETPKKTAKELKDDGYTIKEMKEAGCTAKELKNLGYTAQELKNVGYIPKQLKDAGCTASELKNLGYTITDLKNVGCTASELKNLGYTLRDFKYAGYTYDEVNTSFLLKDLRAAGF
ncbi:MAG: hypothetical protein AB3N34_00855 [Lettuce witches'-broom phytoplasma]